MAETKCARLLELAERCEKAHRPEDLSWEIAQALGWTKYWSGVHIYLPPGATEESGPWCERPRFAESVDGALSLVPADRVWKLHNEEKYGISAGGVRCGAYINGGHKWPGVWKTGYATTPALALCAASLRALAAQETPDAK